MINKMFVKLCQVYMKISELQLIINKGVKFKENKQQKIPHRQYENN